MSVGGVFNGLLGSANADMFAWALRSAYQQQRLFDPAFALRQDPDFYDKLRRDPKVSHALYYRKLLAAGIDWHLEPASSDEVDVQKASIVEALLKKLVTFSTLRFQLAEAIVAGSRWSRVFFRAEAVDVPGFPGRRWVVPVGFRDVDKRLVRQYRVAEPPVEVEKRWIDGDGVEQVRTVVERPALYPWQVFRPGQGWWEDVDSNLGDDHEGPARWIHHVVDDSQGMLGHGSGLSDDLAVSFWAKTQLLQHGLAFAERWGEGGMVLATIDPVQFGDPAGAEYASRRDQTLAALKKMRSESFIAVAKGDTIECVEPTGTGHDGLMALLTYLDDGMIQRILFSILPTGGASDVGSNARAEEEGDSRGLVTKHDRAQLEGTLTQDLVGAICELNETEFVAVGLGGRPNPAFVLGAEKDDDSEKQVAIVKTLLEAGVPLRQDEVYERTGFTPPTDADKVFVMGATGKVEMRDGLGPAKPVEAPAPAPTAPGRAPAKRPALPGTDPELNRPELEEAPGLTRSDYRGSARSRPEHVLGALTINMPATPPAPPQTFNFAPPVHNHHTTIAAPPATVVPAPVVNMEAPAPVVIPAPVVNMAAAAPVVIPAPNVTLQAAPPAVVPAPVVNMAAPAPVVIPAPNVTVNVEAAAPVVVPAPVVQAPDPIVVPAPVVNLTVEPAKRGAAKIEIARDREGRIASAEIVEEPPQGASNAEVHDGL